MGLESILLVGATEVGSFNASKLGDYLYQGSLPPEGLGVRNLGFDALVLCARQYQDGRYEGIMVLKCPMDDATLTEVEWNRAVDAAVRVSNLVRQHKKVLVTCRMGINRSGLVSALTVHLLTGWNGRECVRYVQLCRPGALSNGSFVRALEKRLP
jgi:protein-tyrosine phosphatase